MKETFTRTMMVRDLSEAKVKVITFDNCKYDNTDLGKETEIRYTDLTSWDVIQGGEEAAEIERDLNKEEFDEYHEYLTLHFKDGKAATFRNSHCALFIW